MILNLPSNPNVRIISDIALIIPAYNPIPGWSKQVQEQLQLFRNQLPEKKCTLVLVNDGSTLPHFQQETELLAQAILNVHVVSLHINSGKGAALRKGIDAIEAKYYILTDIDFPYTTASMVAIWQALATNETDIAAGNRSQQYYTAIPGFRAWLSQFLRYLIRKRLRLPVDDSQCGLKGMNQKGKELFLQTKTRRYLYDLEFIVKAAADKHLRLAPIPVELRLGVAMRRMTARVLIQEAGNFMKIFLFRNHL